MAKKTKSSILTPIVLITFYVIFLLIIKSVFPTGEALVSYLASIYGRFGYEIVAIGSAFEALILINFFTPGILAIALGVIFAKAGELDLTLAIFVASGGTLIGYMLDFLLGRFGFANLLAKMGYHKLVEEAKIKIEKLDLKTLSLGFIHPNIGAVVSLMAGALRMDFKNFFVLALLATLIWYSLWGLLIFATAGVFLTVFTKYTLMLFLLVSSIWILIMLFGQRRR